MLYVSIIRNVRSKRIYTGRRQRSSWRAGGGEDGGKEGDCLMGTVSFWGDENGLELDGGDDYRRVIVPRIDD